MAVAESPEDESWEGFGILRGVLGECGADVLGQRLVDMLVCGAVRDMDLPHVLVCTDHTTSSVSLSGPYPDGLAALCAAEADHVLERRQDPDSSTEFSVIALVPPGASEPVE